uniref:Putative secreted protein n=1 Tax=Anopheles triannulatus TaxID=58253 RepID=A0A2M4B483_9DIPT
MAKEDCLVAALWVSVVLAVSVDTQAVLPLSNPPSRVAISGHCRRDKSWTHRRTLPEAIVGSVRRPTLSCHRATRNRRKAESGTPPGVTISAYRTRAPQPPPKDTRGRRPDPSRSTRCAGRTNHPGGSASGSVGCAAAAASWRTEATG